MVNWNKTYYIDKSIQWDKTEYVSESVLAQINKKMFTPNWDNIIFDMLFINVLYIISYFLLFLNLYVFPTL